MNFSALHILCTGAVLAGKISGAMALGRRKKGGLGAKPPAKVFDFALFALRQRSILAQRSATYTRKSCKNERAQNEGEQAK